MMYISRFQFQPIMIHYLPNCPISNLHISSQSCLLLAVTSFSNHLPFTIQNSLTRPTNTYFIFVSIRRPPVFHDQNDQLVEINWWPLKGGFTVVKDEETNVLYRCGGYLVKIHNVVKTTFMQFPSLIHCSQLKHQNVVLFIDSLLSF